MLPEINVSSGWTSFEELISYLSCLEEKLQEEYKLQELRIIQLEKENKQLLELLNKLNGGNKHEQPND